MKAMVLIKPGQPLVEQELPTPSPAAGQLLIQVGACAVCRTDLHIVDGELPRLKERVIPGHEIVGRVVALGDGVDSWKIGDRVGVPWLGWTCGECKFCASGRENLCDRAKFTGYTLDGGFAEYAIAYARYCFSVPERFSEAEAAPLLCAGLIGYRCLRKTGRASKLGIYGFGAAAHLAIQVARYEGTAVYAFTRPGDFLAQQFARTLGAVWAGDATQAPPEKLEAAIIFAPVGTLVPTALKQLEKGGILVCGGIHMSLIPAFSYDLLWGERAICSVANLTRRDGEEFFAIAEKAGIKTAITPYPLARANDALADLRAGRLTGAAVLT